MPIRRPAVAGSFYPRTKEEAEKLIEECFLHPIGPGRLPERGEGASPPPLALISPHAGYVYSGPVAVHGYLQLDKKKKPKTVVILGPNHYGFGMPVSIYPEGAWITPLGEVEIDSELGLELAKESDVFSIDETSHLNEHSIEVQVPFLQYVLGEFKLLPICILDQGLKTCLEIGKTLAKKLEERDDILLVASTDFTHYEPDESAKEKDHLVLEKISSLDIMGMYDIIEEKNISMCGYGPVAAVLKAAKNLGAEKAEVLKYATSGDVTGDRGAVVGYASVKIERTK